MTEDLLNERTGQPWGTVRGGSQAQPSSVTTPATGVSDRKLPPALLPLADALADGASCDAVCSAANEGVRQAVQKEALKAGGAAAQQRAVAALKSYADALEAHAAARSRSAAVLRALLDDQVGRVSALMFCQPANITCTMYPYHGGSRYSHMFQDNLHDVEGVDP